MSVMDRSGNGKIKMTIGEAGYLGLALAGFFVFAATLGLDHVEIEVVIRFAAPAQSL